MNEKSCRVGIFTVSMTLEAIESLFVTDYIKVKFPDMDTGKRGFKLIYGHGHSVNAYGDLTFGLSSKEQLKLLKDNGVQYQTVGSLSWTPLDPNNAIALEFAEEAIYHKARRIALELTHDDIRLPGRNTIILNKFLQPLFDEFKKNYIERKVVSGTKVSSEKLARLRAEHFFPQSSGWKARLGSYRQKKALEFASEEELGRALQMLWHDDDLYGMPRDHADARTIIVPAEAVTLLREKRLAFKEIAVVSSGDLPPERERQLRKAQGMH
jgi:hypothetical protein